MENENWKEFWFEGNLCFGWIKNKEDWNKVKRAYKDMMNIYDLEQAKRCPYSDFDKFGFAIECDGKQTLKEFADKNNMDL